MELWDLVDLVEEDVLADIEDDWDVDLVLLDVLLLSQASTFRCDAPSLSSLSPIASILPLKW